MISTECRALALAHAKEDFPREVCGLFLETKDGKELYFRCKNKSIEKDTFIMDPADYSKAEDQGEVKALFHSHCNYPPRPSPADLATCNAMKTPWVIASLPTETWETVMPTGFEAPYIGRNWVYGAFDCYSLMQDWYRRELKVTLPDFPRFDYWWEKGQNLYMDNLEKHGFKKIEMRELRRGDIILMQVGSKVPNHVAIYLGGQKILQHLINRLSAEYVFGGYWAKVTRYYFRYEGL